MREVREGSEEGQNKGKYSQIEGKRTLRRKPEGNYLSFKIHQEK